MIDSPSQEAPRLNGNRLISLLRDPSPFDKILLIIDCRYQKEYEGGHIRNSLNYSFDTLNNLFDEHYSPNTCFIFHCEYSLVRGPNSLKEFVRICKEKQCEIEPKCFILDHGYKGFYIAHQDYCDGKYTPEYMVHQKKV